MCFHTLFLLRTVKAVKYAGKSCSLSYIRGRSALLFVLRLGAKFLQAESVFLQEMEAGSINA
ncbi:hypothetical protein A3SI_03860 [Nitritalea halalkaliphila LW7]|uniref:Uncharacterized protein n=1 Tax=Nitritalea halalkaliphila LW7 TaxID=1189621 RepID=I5C976_9BACT|nr:hypothetical protein A3SI_03860 [Nitritalea halalkaliphila LW7]